MLLLSISMMLLGILAIGNDIVKGKGKVTEEAQLVGWDHAGGKSKCGGRLLCGGKCDCGILE